MNWCWSIPATASYIKIETCLSVMSRVLFIRLTSHLAGVMLRTVAKVIRMSGYRERFRQHFKGPSDRPVPNRHAPLQHMIWCDCTDLSLIWLGHNIISMFLPNSMVTLYTKVITSHMSLSQDDGADFFFNVLSHSFSLSKYTNLVWEDSHVHVRLENMNNTASQAE